MDLKIVVLLSLVACCNAFLFFKPVYVPVIPVVKTHDYVLKTYTFELPKWPTYKYSWNVEKNPSKDFHFNLQWDFGNSKSKDKEEEKTTTAKPTTTTTTTSATTKKPIEEDFDVRIDVSGESRE